MQVALKAEAAGVLPQLDELLVEASWRTALAPQLGGECWAELQAFVHSEWGGKQMVFPPKDSVFRWA